MPDVAAHITGIVWRIECEVGQKVEDGDVVLVLESMKMEMPLEVEEEGVISEIKCSEGQKVKQGETLIVLE